MKNIDVVALLNQKNAASKKASKAQAKAEAKVEEVEVEEEVLAVEEAPTAEETPKKSAFDSFKESKVGQTADVVWKKANEHKREIAFAAAGVAIVAVVAGVVRHKRRTKTLKLFSDINNK